MSKKALVGILLGVAGLTLACLCAPANLLPIRWTPTVFPPTRIPSQPFETTEASTAEASDVCVYHLSQALQESETTYVSGAELETDFTLVTYSVSGDSITNPLKVNPIPPKLKTYQDDTAAQKKMWRFFTDIIPANLRTQVTQFAVFTDGPNNSLGAVEQTDNPRHWKLEMDIQDSQNFADLSSTLVHEFAHLLTLNDTQVTPDMQVFDHPNDKKLFDQGEANCPAYFLFEGCSQTDSYINRFYKRFWTEIYAEWKQIHSETNEAKLDQDLEDFYDRNKDQFVSSYAVTSPEEDIAETFMYFIFTPKPSGTSVADQKISFFYDEGKMKDLRETLLSQLCRYTGKP